MLRTIPSSFLSTEVTTLQQISLMSQRGSIFWPVRWGWTPLRSAVMAGHELVAALIRSKGGRLQMENAAKMLGQAAHEGDIKTIRMLVDNGVPVDVRDYDSRTALHLASTVGNLLSVYYLIYRFEFLTENIPFHSALFCIVQTRSDNHLTQYTKY